jgi:hypothetical protein
MEAAGGLSSLAALFGKAEATSVQLSPGGVFVGWLARSSNGVLNLFVAPLRLITSDWSTSSDNTVPGAIQLTAAADRDICFSFHFTHDEKRILYLRETRHGSEKYHLYSVKLPECDDLHSAPVPVSSGRDLLADYPDMTCAVGFVGGLQLWLPPAIPDHVILSTGGGSLLWDLCLLDLTSGTMTKLHQNPASTYTGRATLAFALLAHLFVSFFAWTISFLTLGHVTLSPDMIDALAPPPAAPIQYFVDGDGDIVGCAQACISARGLALGFYRRAASKRAKWQRFCPYIPFSQLNMQMIGSGAASGLLRMDRCSLGDKHKDTDNAGWALNVHSCHTANTTAYVRYPGEAILANDPNADIAGFICSPLGFGVEAVVITHARTRLLPVSPAGQRLVAELQAARAEIARIRPVDEDTEVILASRTRADDVWLLQLSADTHGAEWYLRVPPCGPGGAARAGGARLLLCARPVLTRLGLARSHPLVITARDGEQLHAYLTRPGAGQAGQGALALVLHGGPNARDFGGFSPSTALLASRGVAVLTVNYRGSTGFGKKFVTIGHGQLDNMHADVEDARRYAPLSRRVKGVGCSD